MIKKKLSFSKGIAHIQATINNTIVTIVSMQGDTISSASAGQCGFKGPKRGTSFAASRVSFTAGQKAKDLGIKELDIIVRGPGIGRDSAIRSFSDQGFVIKSIADRTPLPHNGTRPRKVRH